MASISPAPSTAVSPHTPAKWLRAQSTDFSVISGVCSHENKEHEESLDSLNFVQLDSVSCHRNPSLGFARPDSEEKDKSDTSPCRGSASTESEENDKSQQRLAFMIFRNNETELYPPRKDGEADPRAIKQLLSGETKDTDGLLHLMTADGKNGFAAWSRIGTTTFCVISPYPGLQVTAEKSLRRALELSAYAPKAFRVQDYHLMLKSNLCAPMISRRPRNVHELGYEDLFSTLSHNNIVKVMEALFAGIKVIMFSNSRRKLYIIAETLRSLFSPLKFGEQMFPFVPQQLLDLLAAPGGPMYGIDKSLPYAVGELEEALAETNGHLNVHLDTDQVNGMQGPKLPPGDRKKLKHSLKRGEAQAGFLRLYAKLFQDYKNEKYFDANGSFVPERFLRDSPADARPFLEAFAQSKTWDLLMTSIKNNEVEHLDEAIVAKKRRSFRWRLKNALGAAAD